MPVDINAVMEVATLLCADRKLRVTVQESLRGGLVVGGAAVAGGLMLGPIGLAIGGTVGGITAAYMASGKFKAVTQVISEMDYDQRERLFAAVHKVVAHLEAADAIMLTQIVMGDMTLQREMVAVIVNFLQNEMNLQIID